MVTAEKRLGAVRGLPARLRADMFRAAYRGCGCFVRFCASAHRNRSRLPASVRRCDCAEMHMIPIADQLAESRPIADQDITHVNDMRSALARPCAATLRSQSVSQRAMRRSQSAPSDARHMARRSQRAMRRSQGKSAQVRGWKVQQNQ
jgi:hypothetical protein